MSAEENPDADALEHLKKVSRVKHVILQKYLPPWARILGSRFPGLRYVDCYAGPGVHEFKGQRKSGSPLIAIQAAKRYLSREKSRQMTLLFVEKDGRRRQSLEEELKGCQPYPEGLQAQVLAEDAAGFVARLLESSTAQPSFFFVDPYGHPLTVPLLNKLLARPHTEALITFMYFRINMDASNPSAQERVDAMFGGKEWRDQGFLKQMGWEREQGFLAYFLSRIQAPYKLRFRIKFDREDRVQGSRTKYYLVHASTHPKAALLMKEVMWPLGDEEGLFDFSGEEGPLLFSSSPRPEELRAALLNRYRGQQVEFDRLREETWELPFIERHYREVLRGWEKEGRVHIERVTSQRHGLGGKDRVRFL